MNKKLMEILDKLLDSPTTDMDIRQAHDQIIELWKGRVKWEDIADIIENATYRQGIALDLNDDKICEIAKNIVQAITQAQNNKEAL